MKNIILIIVLNLSKLLLGSEGGLCPLQVFAAESDEHILQLAKEIFDVSRELESFSADQIVIGIGRSPSLVVGSLRNRSDNPTHVIDIPFSKTITNMYFDTSEGNIDKFFQNVTIRYPDLLLPGNNIVLVDYSSGTTFQEFISFYKRYIQSDVNISIYALVRQGWESDVCYVAKKENVQRVEFYYVNDPDSGRTALQRMLLNRENSLKEFALFSGDFANTYYKGDDLVENPKHHELVKIIELLQRPKNSIPWTIAREVGSGIGSLCSMTASGIGTLYSVTASGIGSLYLGLRSRLPELSDNLPRRTKATSTTRRERPQDRPELKSPGLKIERRTTGSELSSGWELVPTSPE